MSGTEFPELPRPPKVYAGITEARVPGYPGHVQIVPAPAAGSQTDPNACLRYDGGKAPLHLIPVRPLFEVARVYGFGSKKYDDWNWTKGTTWGRCIGSMLRHVLKFAAGEDVDPESGVHHLAHAAFWCLALMEWGKTHPELDDRYKGGWE